MKKRTQSISYSETEVQQVVTHLLEVAGERKKWILYGEIGAGKTTLIKALCLKLGVSDHVTSPTYSIVNEYAYNLPESDQKGYIQHMDLYRLKNEEEALEIGIEEYLFGPDYCFIEWPEIIEHLLPENCFEIQLSIVGDSKRKIIFV